MVIVCEGDRFPNHNAESKLLLKKLATANIFVVHNVVEAIAQTGKILANPT
jgi:hypothetical protein